MADYVKLRYHHGGNFRTNADGGLEYNGGDWLRIHGTDLDELCYFDVLKQAMESGDYPAIKEIFWHDPRKSLKDGLKLVLSDADILELAKNGIDEEGEINFYVVDGSNDPIKIVVADPEVVVQSSPHVNEEAHVIDPPKSTQEEIPHSKKSKAKFNPIKSTYPRQPKTSHIQTNTAQIPDSQPSSETVASPQNHNDKVASPQPLKETVATENKSQTEDWDGVDDRPNSPLTWEDIFAEYYTSGDESEYDPDKDSDTESLEGEETNKDQTSEEDQTRKDQVDEAEQDEVEANYKESILFEDSDSSDDEFRAARKSLKSWNKEKETEYVQLRKKLAETTFETEAGSEARVEEGGEFCSDYEESDGDVDTPGESEEDDIRGKKRKQQVVTVNEHTDWKKFTWCPGIKFPNQKAFREAVTRYAVVCGYSLRYYDSNYGRNQRLGVKCISGCKFKMYASWETHRACYVVKTVAESKHNCNRNMMRNTQFKSKWIAKQFLDIFKEKPHWPAKEIVEAVRVKFSQLIEKPLAYKIKALAHQMLHGSMKDHYSKIGKFLKALKTADGGGVFELVVIPKEPPVFQRMFICFEALKNGLLNGCRKFLCLDGCFLKTFLGGMLLTAVARDGNDQMYPVAWAVVEGENNESWEWFCMMLQGCMGGTKGENWTFMSDQQKGLLNGVQAVFPDAEHRNCARHIYANWHKLYKGDELKILFWRAVRAYNEVDYNEAIEEMMLVDSNATNAFKAQTPKTFCRAFLQTHCKSDVVVNNMAETFNGYIIHSRSKHILDMLEDIRTALMARLVQKKNDMLKLDRMLCPKIQSKLEKEKEVASKCRVLPSSNSVFQVGHFLDEYVVDLENATCSCRKWDLSGIPCCHAVAVVFFLHQDAEPYVSPCYTKEAYLNSYQGSIAALGSQRFWPDVTYPLDPPPIKIGPGRPKKKRRRDPHEDPKRPGKLSRHGIGKTSSICLSATHNKRKCPRKNDPVVASNLPKRGRGRPRKDGSVAGQGLSEASNVHLATAQPSNRGRRGRGRRGDAIRGGRGRTGQARSQATASQGYGLYIDQSSGHTYVNMSGQHGPVNIHQYQPGGSQPGGSQP